MLNVHIHRYQVLVQFFIFSFNLFVFHFPPSSFTFSTLDQRTMYTCFCSNSNVYVVNVHTKAQSFIFLCGSHVCGSGSAGWKGYYVAWQGRRIVQQRFHQVEILVP